MRKRKKNDNSFPSVHLSDVSRRARSRLFSSSARTARGCVYVYASVIVSARASWPGLLSSTRVCVSRLTAVMSKLEQILILDPSSDLRFRGKTV